MNFCSTPQGKAPGHLAGPYESWPRGGSSGRAKHLREEELAPGAVLWKAGDSAGSVFFPASGLISISVPTADGHRTEVAIIGSESAAGFTAKGFSVMEMSGLSRGFSICCLRFKNGVATTPARLASGWLAHLYREGVEPSGSLQKVSDHILIPLFWIYPGATKGPPSSLVQLCAAGTHGDARL